MLIDFASLSSSEVYHTLIQTVIPRPIAWVLTENDHPTNAADRAPSYNLAPFSYFTAVSSTPPLLMFSVGPKPDGSPKDTLANIEAGSEFVVHIASSNLAKQVNTSAAGLPYGTSELDGLDVTITDFAGSTVPRLVEAPIAFACRRFDITQVRDSPQTLIFGEVLHAHLDETVVSRNGSRLAVDATKVDPLVRLGGADYAKLGEAQTIERPK